MCGLNGGIVKVQNGFFHGDSRIIDEMLYIGALRGEDSTGMAVFCTDGEIQVLKDASESAFFRYTEEYKKALELVIKKGKAVIGHNRKKTMGGADDLSAHPFVINDRYVFAHNGTLTNYKSLFDGLDNNLGEIGEYSSAPITQVDSEVLGIMLCSANGDKEKLETMLGKVFGAYACTWIDQQEEKLYMIRNYERPLYLANTAAGYFWASESPFIFAACLRNKVKIETCDLIDVDTLYCFDLSTHAVAMTKEKLSPKKAMPSTTAAPTQTRGTATNATKFPFMSKNAFKKFHKRTIGCRVSFFIDDYLERSVTDRDVTGWHVWGQNEDDIMCRGAVEDMSLDIMEKFWAGACVEGTAWRIAYDSERGVPIIYVNNITHAFTDETCH